MDHWTKKIAQKNDILISVRAPVGDVNIANIDCCIGRGLAAIRPSNKIIYRDYLFYYLKATSQIIFESKKAGSTFDSITGKNLGSTNTYSSVKQQRVCSILWKSRKTKIS